MSAAFDTSMTMSTPNPDQLQATASSYLSYVGAYLRMERKKQKLALREVAALAGRSTSWAGQVERGENSDAAAQKLFALVLGVQLAVFVARAEHQMALDLELGTVRALGGTPDDGDDD